MKPVLPLLLFSAALASCSTTYKSGQTPDDVYYAAGRPVREYEEVEERTEARREDRASQEDRYLRMRVRDRQRWSELDEYYRDPYAYDYRYCQCGYAVNPRLSWGYYYSPYNYYAPVVYRPVVPNTPRRFNFDGWQTPPAPPAPRVSMGGKEEYNLPAYRPQPQGSTRGTSVRDAFNNNSSSSSTPSSSSSSSSSSSGSSSGGSRNAGVRRF